MLEVGNGSKANGASEAHGFHLLDSTAPFSKSNDKCNLKFSRIGLKCGSQIDFCVGITPELQIQNLLG